LGESQQLAEFFGNVRGVSRRGSWVAPSESRTVVTDSASYLGDFRLDICPTEDSRHQAGFENDGGASLATREQMQSAAIEIYKLTRRGMAFAVACRPCLLVEPTSQYDHRDDSDDNENHGLQLPLPDL
jgi:hypothetical protein